MDSVASSMSACDSGLDDLFADDVGLKFPVSRLTIEAPVLSPQATGGEVYNLLTERPDLPCIAILDGDRIVGLVDRISLLDRFSRHLMRDYYVRRPIALVLDPEPLTIDGDQPVRILAARISHEKPQALTAGFIITRQGRYAGVGAAIDMMKVSVEEAQLRAAELARSRRLAEEANRSKTLFLANMSHEFRTPLNAIIGFSEILNGQKFGELNERQAEYVEDIRSSGVHLLALVSDILDLSKAESGKLELHDEPLEVGELVGSCIRLIRERAHESGLHLAIMQPEAPIEILADGVKLTQILMNLLSNAIKFTQRGGRVEIAATILPDGWLEMSVVDTGIGMAPEQIPLALQAFVQIDNSRNRSHQGTGLGLPLCKQLTELHGGRLLIESELGHGTAMRVHLPADRVLTTIAAVSAA